MSCSAFTSFIELSTAAEEKSEVSFSASRSFDLKKTDFVFAFSSLFN